MSRDRGATTVVMTAVVAVLAVVAVATASLGLAYAARVKAQTAADAAALAAAIATYPDTGRSIPSREAAHVARLNDAVLVECSCAMNRTTSARTVRVVTSVAIEVPVFGVLEVRGLARAEFDPRRWLGR